MVKKHKKNLIWRLLHLFYLPFFIFLAPIILLMTGLFKLIQKIFHLIKWLCLSREKKRRAHYLRKTKIDELSGEAFEDYIALLLEVLGFHHIEKTQRSNDYGVDLLAMKDDQSYAVQCKRYLHPVGIKAVQEVIAGMQYYQCDQAIVITSSSFTHQAINLAESIQIILYDRSWIEKKLSQLF